MKVWPISWLVLPATTRIRKNESPTLKAVLRRAPENLRVVQMSENMHREDLDIVDTAIGVVELNTIDKLKPKDICEQLV